MTFTIEVLVCYSEWRNHCVFGISEDSRLSKKGGCDLLQDTPQCYYILYKATQHRGLKSHIEIRTILAKYKYVIISYLESPLPNEYLR